MRATAILAIVAIVVALGAVTSLIPIHPVSVNHLEFHLRKTSQLQ